MGLFACGPNAGIEVGNPKVGGKVVTLHPEGTDATYIIEFITDTSAEVTQIVANEFETVPAQTSLEAGTLVVIADFTGGPHFEAQVEADAEGNILSVALSLDGVPTPVTVQSQPADPAIKPLADNGPALVVSSLCERIIECHPETVDSECETAVAEQPGLAQEFGRATEQNLSALAQELHLGGLAVDEEDLARCLEAMALVPCAQVDKGYDPNSQDAYKKIKLLIPKPLCTRIFASHH